MGSRIKTNPAFSSSIARSMGQKSSIEELLLYREEKNPHQIRIQLKFINGGQSSWILRFLRSTQLVIVHILQIKT